MCLCRGWIISDVQLITDWIMRILVWISKHKGESDKGLTGDKQSLRPPRGRGVERLFLSPLPPEGKNKTWQTALARCSLCQSITPGPKLFLFIPQPLHSQVIAAGSGVKSQHSYLKGHRFDLYKASSISINSCVPGQLVSPRLKKGCFLSL